VNVIGKGLHIFYRTEAVLNRSQLSNDIWIYGSFIYFLCPYMPFLVPTLNNDDPLFGLATTPCFYLHHIEVADQDKANGWL